MRFPKRAAAVLLAGSALLGGAGAPLLAQSPFPPREGLLAVEDGIELSAARLSREFDELALGQQGQDALMLVVQSCQPDPEVYVDEALVHYGLAPGPGELYDDALLWLVCYEPRFAGFYYGRNNPLAPSFEAADLSTQVAQAMAERLGNGNLTGALAAGMERVDDAVPVVPADAQAAAPPAEAQDEDPTGGDSIPVVPWLVLGGCGLGGLWLWRREKAAKAAAAAPRAPSAMTPRAVLEAKMADLARRLTADSPAFSRLALAFGSISDQAMLEVSQKHAERVRLLQLLQGRVGRLPAGAISDTELAALTAEADQLLVYTDGIEREAEHADMLQEKAPVLAVDARKAIAAARAEYDAQRAHLAPAPLPAPVAALSLPESLVDQAEAKLSAGDRLSAGRLAEDAQTLAERIAQSASRAVQLDRLIEEGVGLYDRIEAYAPSNWADIRGNGSEAEESLETALTLLDRILAAAPGSFGADLAAGLMTSLDKVHAELDRAQRLVDGIGERLARLEQARASGAATLERLRSAIADARAWLARAEVAQDVDDAPAGLLGQAEAQAQELAQAMGREKPDWLAIQRGLETAQQAVAQALDAAKAQDARLDALQAQWDTSRRAAADALERAERYLTDHRADASTASAGLLEPARAALREADETARAAGALDGAARAEGLGRAANRAEVARDAADHAYEQVAADVAREDQRRSYVPRSSWIGPTVPSPVNRRVRLPLDPFGGGWGAGSGGVVMPGRSQARPSPWGGRPRAQTRAAGGRGSSTRRGGGTGW